MNHVKIITRHILLPNRYLQQTYFSLQKRWDWMRENQFSHTSQYLSTLIQKSEIREDKIFGNTCPTYKKCKNFFAKIFVRLLLLCFIRARTCTICYRLKYLKNYSNWKETIVPTTNILPFSGKWKIITSFKRSLYIKIDSSTDSPSTLLFV